MPKCNKVKNPCKICLKAVTQKNGLKCHGACESWVHYGCLNYTPGRIKDIKSGILKVTCPCPDCTSVNPKEYRTDDPPSCANMKCVANQPQTPVCVNKECPINKDEEKFGRGAGADGMMQTSMDKVSSGPLGKNAGKPLECNPHSNQMRLQAPIQRFSPPNIPMASSSDTCLICNSDFAPNFQGDMRMGNMGGGFQNAPCNLPSMVAMEQMCNTVGLLSKQIQQLMEKMNHRRHIETWRPTTPCTQKGPKSSCHKPCFCPGNPKLSK